MHFVSKRKEKNSNLGFTLIELLVVIAIIAVISSIILASLNSTKIKGEDTALKANLNNIRAQALIFYDVNGSNFGTTSTDCATTGSVFLDGNVALQISNAVASGSGVATCNNDSQTWAVSVPLKSDGTLSWCVDSKHQSKQIVGSLASSQYSCP